MKVNSFSGKPLCAATSLLRLVFILTLILLPLTPDGGVRGQVHAATAPVDVTTKMTPESWRKVQAGEMREVLVLFEATTIDPVSAGSLRQRAQKAGDPTAIALRAERYRTLKSRTLSALPLGDMELLRDYRHIPMAYVRVRNADALLRLLARAEVVAVFENKPLYLHLTQSLPLIGQPSVNQVMGRTGSGTTVVVLDTGVDYTRAEFGACTAPGVPAACRVVAAFDTAPEDNARDANGHGTWVAGVATAVAPGARIAAIDVFNDLSASSVDVIEGIDWAIANRALYNIVAINMSLGDGFKYTTACSGIASNPYRQPLIDARNAGILSVVSSGNDGFTDGIANPACTPEAVSVGAVYDANVGSLTWTGPDPDCTDSVTTADKVACFSNSASFLTLLAPGALMTVTGATVAGTSLSAPVVTGALAVLAQAFPSDTATARLNRLTANGKSVTDARNAIVKPRIDLLTAQGVPVNDAFALAVTLSGTSGTATGWNLNATLESGEPVHAGISGGKSVWWQWTAGASGTVALNTHSSGFDTLLAAYTGSSVSALATVTSNDNDGSAGNTSGLSFQAVAGTTYRIAVAGKAGASGAVTLAWTLLQAQTINFPIIANQTLGTAPFSVTATASSGLTVSLSSLTPLVCSVSGNTVTLLATGTCTLQATQPGNSQYNAAPAIARTFTVTSTSGGGSSNDGDVPIPLWATILLGAGLLGAMRRAT